MGPPKVPLIFITNETIVSTETEAKNARPVDMAPIKIAKKTTFIALSLKTNKIKKTIIFWFCIQKWFKLVSQNVFKQ